MLACTQQVGGFGTVVAVVEWKGRVVGEEGRRGEGGGVAGNADRGWAR